MSIRDNLGGGSAGSVLDTLEEIEANTEEGKAAGALAVKELNDSLKTVKTYVGEDGKLHFVDSEGADTVLPFSSFKRYYSETTIATSSTLQTVEVGFRPKLLYLFSAGITWMYIEPLFGEYFFYNGDLAHKSPIGSWDSPKNLMLSEITDDGFSVKTASKFNLYVLAYG